jgi:hypothetical protein
VFETVEKLIDHFGGFSAKKPIPWPQLLKHMQENFDLHHAYAMLIYGQDINPDRTIKDDDDLTYEERINALRFFALVKKVFFMRSYTDKAGLKVICVKTMAILIHEIRMKINTIMLGCYSNFSKAKI